MQRRRVFKSFDTIQHEVVRLLTLRDNKKALEFLDHNIAQWHTNILDSKQQFEMLSALIICMHAP